MILRFDFFLIGSVRFDEIGALCCSAALVRPAVMLPCVYMYQYALDLAL